MMQQNLTHFEIHSQDGAVAVAVDAVVADVVVAVAAVGVERSDSNITGWQLVGMLHGSETTPDGVAVVQNCC